MCNVIKRRNKGSSTIETALIISAILLILASMVYSSLILYQKLLLSKTAQYIAQQGAMVWTDNAKNIYNGSMKEKTGGMSMGELYYQLLDDSMLSGRKIIENIDISSDTLTSQGVDNNSLQDRKLIKMKDAIRLELSKGLLKPSLTKLEIDYSNILIKRKIDISIKQEIKLPFGPLKKALSGKDTITLIGTGAASIEEPEEFIRNSDLLIEYVSGSGAVSSLSQKINDLKDKLKVRNR
jgi:hypothetical protein